MNNEVDITTVGFSVNKFVLSAIGQWPYQSKWQRSLLRILGNGIMILANFSSVRIKFNEFMNIFHKNNIIK